MTASVQIDSALLQALYKGKEILCVSHVAPDGDALGSLLGIGWILRRLGKNPTLSLEDPTPVEHRVLPGADDIVTKASGSFESTVRNREFDLIVCVDASSPDRMGIAYNAPVHKRAQLVVIDHHITNVQFGDVNWVEPSCAATCQMLVYLADALDVPLQNELAECLLTGIVTDTLAFRTSNTTPDLLGAAMRCMEGGANLSAITQRTVNRRPFSVLQTWAKVLPDMQMEDGVIWTTVSAEDLGPTNGVLDLNLSSFLVTADEADISAVFTERLTDGVQSVECSFRAKPGFDVASVAFSFGGGGHPAASGCTIKGTMSEVVELVIPSLKAARNNPPTDGA